MYRFVANDGEEKKLSMYEFRKAQSAFVKSYLDTVWTAETLKNKLKTNS